MAKPNFTLPNKPAIKSGSILSYNYTDDFTFVPAPLTFNRDSAATRVNEKGLIEDVGYFGPELVQNGDFEQIGPDLVINGDFATNSNWNLGAGQWTISNGFAVADNASNNLHTSSPVATATGLQYKVTFTLQDVSQGYVKVGFSSHATTQFNSDGTYTLYIQSDGNRYLYFTPYGFTGKLTNVSVKEVGQNWTFGGTASISDGKATINSPSGEFAEIYQSSVLTIGNKYKLEYTLDKTSGDTQFVNGGTFILENGSNTIEFIATDKRVYFKRGAGSVISSIDNISVIEILGDKPRIDYSDSLTEPSLLLEPQSTNLFSYSEDFSQSVWDNEYGNQVINPNVEISPSGTLTADKLTVSSGTITERKLWYPQPTTVGLQYTFSVYIKAVSNQVNTGFISIANLDSHINQTFFTATDVWQRVVVTATSNSATSIRFLITGDPNCQIYIWGAQLEQGSYPTSYIPTFGSTATRLGETANNAGDVNVFNSEEGTLYAEIAALADNLTFRVLSVSDGSNNNTVKFGYRSDSNRIYAEVRSGGSSQAFLSYDVTDITDFNKVALKYKANDFALWINGAERATDTIGIVSVNLDTLNFDNGEGANDFYGKVRNVQVFNKALTDRELEILTIQ